MTLFVEALRWLIDTSHWTGSGSIPQRLVEHFSLSLVTVALAAFLALPVGVYIGHTGRGAGVVGAVAGVARAIPTLGLLTIFGLALGIGVVAPALALIVLAVPSLLAGAYAGIHAIEPAVPAAAKAIGMSPMQVVWRVEIPLALPVMIGGLRSATLQVVATATLAAYTADVGLGRYLFSGLKSRDYAQMLGGSLLVIGLALLAELGLMLLQRFARRKADPAK